MPRKGGPVTALTTEVLLGDPSGSLMAKR
jgi:hypothetical protein